MAYAIEKAELMNKLRQGGYSSCSIAEYVVRFMRKVIATAQFSNLDELVSLLSKEGAEIMRVQTGAFVVGNMVTRVLKLIREEHSRLMRGSETSSDQQESLQTLWDSPLGGKESVSSKQLRLGAIETLSELLTEIDTANENMAVLAPDLLSDGDIVITYAQSNTVESFLKAALRKRKITVLVGECAPSLNGRKMAERLRLSGKDRDVHVITDASLFDNMTKATKVVMGATSVLGDGSVLSPCGAYSLALVAQHYSVPVIVCAAFYKLTPRILSPSDQSTFNYLASPRFVVPFHNGDIVGNCDIVNPVFDFIPVKLISLYVTQSSANAPSYIYRLLSEQFHPDDVARLWSQSKQ